MDLDSNGAALDAEQRRGPHGCQHQSLLTRGL
jgi:hypothetical protein